MASLTGTQSDSFNSRGKGTVSVTIVRERGGTLRVEGLTNDDDATQMRELEDAISYTKGGFGSTSVNINSLSSGEVVIKLLDAHTDNIFMSEWLNEVKSGSIDPATITFSSANYRDVAFKCLPVKFADSTPMAGEDPGKEWRILASKVSLNEPLVVDQEAAPAPVV